jgi:hypothetical protein
VFSSGRQIYGHKAFTLIGWNISTERQQLISSLMTLGAFISSGTAGITAAKLGRKTCLWLAYLLCAISTIIMMATETIEALYVGRLLIGLANWYFMTFSQLYIQESSPAKYRGLFLAVFTFCTSIVSLEQHIQLRLIHLSNVKPGHARGHHCGLGYGETTRQISIRHPSGSCIRDARRDQHCDAL